MPGNTTEGMHDNWIVGHGEADFEKPEKESELETPDKTKIDKLGQYQSQTPFSSACWFVD